MMPSQSGTDSKQSLDLGNVEKGGKADVTTGTVKQIQQQGQRNTQTMGVGNVTGTGKSTVIPSSAEPKR
jgi:hypothetical protein